VRAGTGGAGQIEGGLDLVIATEIALPPDDRGALGPGIDRVLRKAGSPCSTKSETTGGELW
jgi:hypothetical protein